MGFCRRCGDIVAGPRCKCGGTPVAAVVPWNQSDFQNQPQDQWSRTYVSRERSPTRPLSRGPPSIITHTTGSTVVGVPPTSSSPTKHFPHSTSTISTTRTALGNRVSAHIASATSQINHPPSPLKHSSTLPALESDIIPSLYSNDSTLSKVYGSVLQPRESLATHSCGMCSSLFLPDATIYPDPSASASSTPRFLCRACFTANGGSKGNCPTCSRPVLILKSEGGFVHAVDQFWHKKCFNCDGCFKNIGDTPMVDLLGRPSCRECFDNHLNRDPNTPKKTWSTDTYSPRTEKSNNLGGMNTNSNATKTSEASPAIEELEQRLGIVKDRQGSPALEELSQRLSMIGKEIGTKYSVSGSPITSPGAPRYSVTSRENSPLIDRSRGRRDSRPETDMSPTRRFERFKSPDFEQQTNAESRTTPMRYSTTSPSPVRHHMTGSPAPTQAAIEEMKQRLLRSAVSPPSAPSDLPPLRTTPPLRISRSSTSLSFTSRIPVSILPSEPASPRSPILPPTPDLMSDFSDTMTQSSYSPDSPPRDETPAEGDVFNDKPYGRDYGARYTRSDFLDSSDAIAEETKSQMGTPTHTPKSTAPLNPIPMSTPSKTLHSSVLPPPISKQSKSMRSPPQKPLAAEIPPSSNCAKCAGALFAVREGGKFVTVPDAENGKSKRYHPECFRCVVCEGLFREGGKGQAVFVKASGGPCHVECVPPEKITLQQPRNSNSFKNNMPSKTPTVFTSSLPLHTTQAPISTPTSTYTSSRYDRSPQTAPPISTPTTFPRFGSRTACPGCHKSVSPMEFGVVPGPQGTRWHASCLVCGGKKEASKGWIVMRGREERKKNEPGCGKKLDSAAKSDGEGGVWCRECLLILGVGGSPQASPTRGPLVPSFTGASASGKMVPQTTGTTTIARQFTGLGGGEPGILRQLTGGGLSPTRSISPTKQLGMTRPRPKSVIGMRSSKSVDEGRGMYLVRQFTGAGSNNLMD